MTTMDIALATETFSAYPLEHKIENLESYLSYIRANAEDLEPLIDVILELRTLTERISCNNIFEDKGFYDCSESTNPTSILTSIQLINNSVLAIACHSDPNTGESYYIDHGPFSWHPKV